MTRSEANLVLFQRQNGRTRKTHTKWNKTHTKCGMKIRSNTLLAEQSDCANCQTMSGPEPPRLVRRPARQCRTDNVKPFRVSDRSIARVDAMIAELSLMLLHVDRGCVDYKALVHAVGFLSNVGIH